MLTEQKLRFVDFCNDSLTQTLLEDVGIDDSTILVEDYLPLIGVVHPGWRFTSDVKSCTVGGSGCQDTLPIHTNTTIGMGIHRPKTFNQDSFDSMGYYLDNTGITYSPTGLIKASQEDACLFNPFKILIDIECSLNRVKRKNFPLDPPTLLEGIQEWPAKSCKGTNSGPQCLCEETSCYYNYGIKKGRCQGYLLYGATAVLVQGSYISCDTAECIDETGTGEPGDPIIPCSYSGEQQQGNYLYSDPDNDDEYYPNWALHPDIVEDPPVQLDGRLERGECCGEYVYCYQQLEGNWKYNPCDGQYYRIDGSIGSLTWTCRNNEYLFTHPSSDEAELDCHCQNISNSLCDAKIVCQDFSTCACNPIPLINIGEDPEIYDFNQEDVMQDCECKGMPLADLVECDSKSLIKWTITESA